jgi:hypothetical protein
MGETWALCGLTERGLKGGEKEILGGHFNAF